ncbi:unnamed protein product [Onchocerca flexuosa]|uniref:Uncharacterized protein n=1 Tax=Onchocerca flexuosa TaxID=387005 RepID=A0A183GYU4_9BILA|nr:unnamed protein product [Onchocerca flexuosa]
MYGHCEQAEKEICRRFGGEEIRSRRLDYSIGRFFDRLSNIWDTNPEGNRSGGFRAVSRTRSICDETGVKVMAFAQPKTSVEIPLKDSTENDMQRYVRDFCTEIWNMTQRWEELNGSTYNLLEKIINNRLCIIYAQSVDVVEERDLEKDRLESDLTALLLGEKGSDCNATNVESARNRLERNEISRITEKIVQDVERLVDLVNVQMARIVGQLQKMRERLAGLRKLEHIQGDRENLPRLQNPKLKELSEILPLIVKMYQEELKAKRAALDDLANFNSRDIFLTISASWSHQAFIDRSTLSRLYSLVV